MNEKTEERLLRLIKELIETIVEDTAYGVSQASSDLYAWGPMLGRLASKRLREKIMSGRIDLMTITGDMIEEEIALAIAEAAGMLTRSRLIAVPGGASPPPSTDRENPRGE